ncbi:MAG: alkane 1-monooxygenase [Pseudomonadota bacterium]
MPIFARYAIVTLLPVLLIMLGAVFGGIFALLALVWLTLVAAGLDQVLPDVSAAPLEAHWADRLSIILAVIHLLMVPVLVLSLDNQRLFLGELFVLFLAIASFIGQVSHPNAHNLIHRSDRPRRALGAAVYVSVLYGSHVSSHRLVHHAHVGTPQDPATPQPGEDFWSYVARAWPGNMVAGFAAETARLEKRGLTPYAPQNPYLIWIAGALATLVFVTALGGIAGLICFVALACAVHLQILMSDYIQHYGLQRLRLPGGRIEPVSAHHSWDAPGGFSGLLMMAAPRHAEHHMNASRPFQALGSDGTTAPALLPYPMPIMAVLACLPSVWRRVMDHRALRVMEAAKAQLSLEDHAEPGDLRAALTG